jgi:hypothetical protein
MRQIPILLLSIFLSCKPNQEPKQPIAKTDSTETANNKINPGDNPFIPNQNLDTAKNSNY